MKAKIDYPLILSGLLAGLLLGTGQVGAAVVLVSAAAGGVWLWRTSAGQVEVLPGGSGSAVSGDGYETRGPRSACGAATVAGGARVWS
jgi:hypothetical protein